MATNYPQRLQNLMRLVAILSTQWRVETHNIFCLDYQPVRIGDAPNKANMFIIISPQTHDDEVKLMNPDFMNLFEQSGFSIVKMDLYRGRSVRIQMCDKEEINDE